MKTRMNWGPQWSPIALGLLLAACGLPGCAAPDDPPDDPDDPEELATSTDELTWEFSTTAPDGYTVGLEFASNAPAGTVRIAACDPWVIYAVTANLTLFASGDSGTTWSAPLPSPASTSIACDVHRLFAYDPTVNALRVAFSTISASEQRDHRRTDGTFDSWSGTIPDDLPPGLNDIRSGDGMIYGRTSTGAQYYRDYSGWHYIGTGTTTTGWGTPTLSSPAARAFRLDAGGGIVRNDTTFTGYNGTWAFVPSGPHTWADLAGTMDPDPFHGTNYTNFRGAGGTLFGLTTDAKVYRFRFAESNCTDGIDNDADGFSDAADSDCIGTLAQSYCSTHAAGTYCLSRLPNASTLQPGLMTCGSPFNVQLGACTPVGGGGSDTFADTTIPEPPVGIGHWCVIKRGSAWDVQYGASPADPCTALQNAGTGDVTGAGLYTVAGYNNVALNCDGFPKAQVRRGWGTEPIAALRATYVNNTNCLMVVSPDALPIFNSPYAVDATSIASRHQDGGSPFDFPVVGGNCATTFNGNADFDRYGEGNPPNVRRIFEPAHDRNMDQGTPIVAMADGVVDVSHDRAFSAAPPAPMPTLQTSHQSVVFVKYSVGTGSYKEEFVTAYAHLRHRRVLQGQRVKKGQLLGFSGDTGASDGPHVDFNTFKMTNTPLSATLLAANRGPVLFAAPGSFVCPGDSDMTFSTAIDPWGWGMPSGFLDPRVAGDFVDSNTGLPVNMFKSFVGAPVASNGTGGADGRGAFSIKLWATSAQTPPYSECPVDAAGHVAAGSVQGYCDLSREMLPVPAGGGPNAYTRGDGVSAIVGVGNDNHVYELAFVNNAWSRTDLTWLSRNPSFLSGGTAPVATGQARGYKRADNVSAVVYRGGSNNHIYEISLSPGGSWALADLTALSGAPADAASSPAGYVRGGVSTVVYTNGSGRVIELTLSGGAWHKTDLMTSAAAWNPAPGVTWSSPTPYVRQGGVWAVVYIATTGHVWELSHSPGQNGWAAADLTVLSGSAVNADYATYNELSAYVRSDNVNAVLFRGTNNHLYEISLGTSGGWNLADLNVMASGSAPTGFMVPVFPLKNLVTFRGSNNHLYQMSLTAGGSWGTTDLTPSANFPDSASQHATHISRSDGVVQTVYVGANRTRIRGIASGGGNAVLAE